MNHKMNLNLDMLSLSNWIFDEASFSYIFYYNAFHKGYYEIALTNTEKNEGILFTSFKENGQLTRTTISTGPISTLVCDAFEYEEMHKITKASTLEVMEILPFVSHSDELYFPCFKVDNFHKTYSIEWRADNGLILESVENSDLEKVLRQAYMISVRKFSSAT